MLNFNGRAEGAETVRAPAVAGAFYPENPDSLKHDVAKYLADGKPLPHPPRILVSPHAGYVFSGPVAGKGYATLDPKTQTVIILGVPHHAYVHGMAGSGASWFETPLGKVAVDRDRMQKLLKSKLAYIDDNAHLPEHSIEAQLPFLQVTLGTFKIVPLIVHDVDPAAAADLLFPLIDETTTVVASSDFSHYHSNRDARRLDDASIKAILAGTIDGPIDACGEMPIRVAMALAKKMNLSPLLLDARTSFDTYPERGTENRVVGYASIVFLAGSKSAGDNGSGAKSAAVKGAESGSLTDDVKKKLLTLARASLEASVKGESLATPHDLPAMTKENRGCFVTLTEGGSLRGCIGYIEPIKPLYQAVIENARNAALSDPRFPRVTAGELASIRVEVSVLTKPEPLDHTGSADLLAKLVPGVDGIILQQGPYQSTFLPQVWEQLPDKVEFLEHLSLKGGMESDGWKTAHVKRYRAEHFSE
jgi:MEMO1 family protein